MLPARSASRFGSSIVMTPAGVGCYSGKTAPGTRQRKSTDNSARVTGARFCGEYLPIWGKCWTPAAMACQQPQRLLSRSVGDPSAQVAQCTLHSVEHALPISAATLAEQSMRRIPRAVLALHEPAPVG